MELWIKNFKGAWFLIGIGATSIMWLFSHFATQSQAMDIIDQAKATEVRVLKYVDEKDSNVNNRLESMEKVLERIDTRIDTLYRRVR